MIHRELDLIAKAVLRQRSLYLALLCELAFGFVIICSLLQTSHWYMGLTYADAGYSLDDLLTITVEQPAPRGPNAEQQARAWRQEMLDRVRQIPGIRAAAATESALNELPRRVPVDVRAIGADETGAPGLGGAYSLVVGPGIDQVFGLRVASGASFAPSSPQPEDGSGVRPVWISKSLSTTLFGTEHSAGRLLEVPGEPRGRVQGVLDDIILVNPFLAHAKDSLIWIGDPGTERRVQLAARVGGRPLPDVQADVVAALRRDEPDRLVVAEPIVRGHMRADRVLRGIVDFLLFTVALIGAAGLVSTSALGAFLVSQRTHQIGIKRALGASRRTILLGVVLETLLVTTVGSVLGLALTAVFFHWIGAKFGGLRLSWTGAGATCLLLFGNGVLAAYLPARRAASIPPSVASQGAR